MEAGSPLLGFALLGHMQRRIEEEDLPPADPQIQLRPRNGGWCIYGGPNFPEPVKISLPKLYKRMLDDGELEAAQELLDKTRINLGEMRIQIKRLKGKEKQMLEDCWKSLREELTKAQALKPAPDWA